MTVGGRLFSMSLGCGPTGGSFFTHGQLKNPAFSEIAAKTHSPYLVDHLAFISPALELGWIFYLPRGKN